MKDCLIRTGLLTFICMAGCGPSERKEQPVTPSGEDGRYAEHVRTSGFQTPEEEMAQFILPPGFEITLFASEPDITKPINMAFDAKGRLWVSQSSEYPIEAGQGEGKDRITVLEDTDGDGRADKIQDFVNDLNIPIGIIPVKNGAIGYSIPNLYRFIDSDGDGKADQREVLLGEFEHKDTHGMVNNLFRGFDGWIHASHGFSNSSTVSGKDGHAVTMTSGNTFRFTMDGSRVEKTTDGRINPFGSDYDEMGYHYSADCHTLPIYQLIWGGNYSQWGKRTPNMGFAPEMMDYGLNSTALSGLVYYTDNQFPEEYRNSFYSGDVVTCRISRNTMEFHGSTPKATRQDDFLVSKDPWFRPVDIKIGPDGAMYVADFYNRIIGHYEVPLDHPGRDRVSGRIWRITYKGQRREVKDWSKASQEELLEGMGNDVLQLRRTVTDELVDRFGKDAVPALVELAADKNTPALKLIQVNWALFRLDALPEESLANALTHADPRVRVHAYKLLSNYAQLNSVQRNQAIGDLSDANPHVRRAAAEMLSLHIDPSSFRKLVEIHGQIPAEDTHLNYTVSLAIFNHLKDPSIMKTAVGETWPDREAGLLTMVMSDLENQEAGEFVMKQLMADKVPGEKWASYTESAVAYSSLGSLSGFLGWLRQASAADSGKAYLLASAAVQGVDRRGIDIPQAYQHWIREVASGILSAPDLPKEDNKGGIGFAIAMASRLKLDGVKDRLRALVLTKNIQEEIRSQAAKALVQMDRDGNTVFVLKRISDGGETALVRSRFVSALDGELTSETRRQLAESMGNAPPEVQEAIAVLLAVNDAGKQELISAVKNGHVAAGILKIRAVEERFLNGVTEAHQKDFEMLTANVTPVSEEKQQLIANRLASFNPTKSSATAGKAIFQSNCGICHQIRNEGGLIGPQLDGIGNWGQEALATKILDPNRNITENFRNYWISLKNGQTVTGLYRREEGQSLILANQSGEEFSVSKADVAEQVISKSTLMPDNFDQVLTPQAFNDLLIYLLNEK